MTNFIISIISDTVCPWCFVGKRRLERAISQYRTKHPSASADTFSITWLPYYLNPSAPKHGTDKRQHYYLKFGEARANAIFSMLSDVGKGEGIKFSFDGKMGSTRDSHRIIQLAGTKSAESQDRTVEALFRAYFEKERDITSHQVILEAAVEAGLDEEEAREVLSSDRFGPEVDRETATARAENIGGVPHFTIQDRFSVSGAQESAAFLQLFERVKAMDP